VLVEREIGDEPLQPIVLVLELPQAAQLTHAQVRVLFLPGVEGGFANPELAAHIADQKYIEGTSSRVPAAGGRFIVRGGRTFVVNGAPPKRIVVIQWESLEKARAFFESDAYTQLIPIRDKSSNFRAFVIEGVAN
jgi:uncharacterized protein (DUF1330 family)